MNDFQAYMFLLNDSIVGALVFLAHPAYAADAMLVFGHYNPYLILITSLAGSIIGSIINWVIGNLLRKLEKFERFERRAETLKNAEILFNHKGKWILLLAMIPIWGPLFTLLAGVLRFNFFHFLILVIFSKFIGFSLAIFF